MKVLVLGAGVIGITAAYELAGAGHQVVVVDRQGAPALETSFANAGEVSPGYSAPWAGPGVPLKAIKWLAMHHRPLVVRANIDWALVRWALAMLRNCTAARYEINKTRMVRLAEYSRDCLRALRAETGIAYDERMQGTLQLFRTQKQLDGSAGDIAVLRERGIAFELLDRDGCIRHEPALVRVREKFVGGLHLPGDETGTVSSSRSVSLCSPPRAASFSASRRRSPHSRAAAKASSVSRPRPAGSTPTRTWSRSAASRRCFFGRSASASRSIRSRAIRSRCRLPSRPARPSRR
jgi:hypothetical protein